MDYPKRSFLEILCDEISDLKEELEQLDILIIKEKKKIDLGMCIAATKYEKYTDKYSDVYEDLKIREEIISSFFSFDNSGLKVLYC